MVPLNIDLNVSIYLQSMINFPKVSCSQTGFRSRWVGMEWMMKDSIRTYYKKLHWWIFNNLLRKCKENALFKKKKSLGIMFRSASDFLCRLKLQFILLLFFTTFIFIISSCFLLEFWNHKFKGALSGLRQFLATESPLKMMKYAFYFTLKALFVLNIFRFFVLTFWSCIKTTWLDR